MSHEPEEYGGLLKALRETPDEDLAGVSIDRAIRDGRRTVRRRRVLGGAAVVALIAAVSATPLVLDAVRPDKPQPVGPVPTTVQPFDVWSRAFDVGSAGGFTPHSYTSARRWQSVTLVPAENSGLDASATATMYATGAYASPIQGDRLDDIQGRPVYVLVQDLKKVEVAWRYSDNGWATVTVSGSRASADRARHVAESIQLRDKAVPLTVPFTIGRSAVGSDRVVAVTQPHGKPATPQTISVDLGSSDPADPTAGAALTTVGVIRPAPTIQPTTTIAGHPAAVSGRDITVLDLGNDYAGIVHSTDKSPTAIAATLKLLAEAGTNNPIS